MSYSLRHARQTTDPETILIAAENLQNAHMHICKAFRDLNGDSKAELAARAGRNATIRGCIFSFFFS